MARHIPDYFLISESATAGCEIAENIIPLKLKKSFGLKLAVTAATKHAIYRSGRADSSKLSFYYWNKTTGVPTIITNLAPFLRGCIKPHKRSFVTEKIVEEVESHWRDVSLGLTIPLPPQNHRYPVLQNGYFDVLKGNFHKYKLQRWNPGYCHFVINTSYSTKKCYSFSSRQVPVALGQLVTGFPMNRNLICCHNNVAAFLIQILKAALPDEGAIQELPASAPKPDCHDAADSDSHCLILKISTATDMSATLFSKLQILAKSQKPVLIVTEFKPFIPDGVDIDEAMNMQASIRIVTAVTPEDLSQIDPSNVENVSKIVSCSLRAMSDLVNSVEGDICPEAQDLFERVDPNNIKDMLKKLRDVEIEDSGDSSDIITVQDLTEKLTAFVNSAGGDGTKISVNGVGKYIKDLKIRKDNIRLPGAKGKVSAIIGYRWK